MSRHEVSQAENAIFLRGKLLEVLLAARPVSPTCARQVLDVGCGKGQLLDLCTAAGVLGIGLENSDGRVQTRSAPIILGSAEELPFRDGGLPWVVMRHVAHHLADAPRAVRELGRVAARGVLIAEPWRPVGEPAQETARSIDDWCKRHHRRRGMVHDADVPVEKLVEWLQADQTFELRIERVSRPVDLPLMEVAADMQSAIDDLPPEHAEHAHARELLTRGERTGIGATGSAILIVRLK